MRVISCLKYFLSFGVTDSSHSMITSPFKTTCALYQLLSAGLLSVP